MASLVIYDDGDGCLGPMTDLRPVFDLRTGAHRTLERIERRMGRFPVAWWVPEALKAIWSQSTETPVNALPATVGPAMSVIITPAAIRTRRSASRITGPGRVSPVAVIMTAVAPLANA